MSLSPTPVLHSLPLLMLSGNSRGRELTEAGMAISKPILEQTLDEYKRQMSVNGKAPTPTRHNPSAQSSLLRG